LQRTSNKSILRPTLPTTHRRPSYSFLLSLEIEKGRFAGGNVLSLAFAVLEDWANDLL